MAFTYTGYLDTSKTILEIPDFYYAYPMLAFGPNSWFYCEYEDIEDEITAIKGFKNDLIIFTGKCMYLWQEGMKDPVKISADVGCLSQMSIREYEGMLVWLGPNGIMSWDGKKITNMSVNKMNDYILTLNRTYAWRSVAAVMNHRYYISGPFNGNAENDIVLVYDFFLNTWHVRRYAVGDISVPFYIDYLYKYNDGSKETLYGAGHDNSGSETPSYIVKLDTGYDDGGAVIPCQLKLKYFDFGAPDIIKGIRALNIDLSNYAGFMFVSLYLDDLVSPSYSHFIDTRGDPLVDGTFTFSLPSGLYGSRFQFNLLFFAGTAPTYVRNIDIDWRTVRRVPRRYGG